jgi:protein transport protein SEC31
VQQPKSNGAATPSRLASKYGDGFVTSASHPELAEQYGNVGTSNPYTGASRPGTAAAVIGGVEKAPVSATFDPNAIPDLSAEHQPIKDALIGVVLTLSSVQLTTADKKQLSEAEKGIAILLKRLARDDIDSEVASRVLEMSDALRSRDFATAAAIQTDLVHSDWRHHKDWLKGIKNLIQLATKKLHG